MCEDAATKAVALIIMIIIKIINNNDNHKYYRIITIIYIPKNERERVSERENVIKVRMRGRENEIKKK